jgi:hypothetical protein
VATGTLPGSLGEVGPAGKRGPAASASARVETKAPPRSGKSPRAGQPRGPRANPAPDLQGLCRAYRAETGQGRREALDSPAFRALVEAAGSKERVPSHCADILAGKPGGPKEADGEKPGRGHGQDDDRAGPPGQDRDGRSNGAGAGPP